MNDIFVERRQQDRRSTDRRQGERRKFERRADVRKQNQDAIREHMEKYKVLLKDIKDAYFEVDVLGNFTVVNTAMCDALGYGAEELIGEKYWSLMDKDAAKRLKEAVEDLHQKDQPVHLLDMVARKKDGAKVIYEAMVSVIRDVEGVVIGFRGVGRDVTARREMEAELKRNQEELLKKNREIDESRKKLEAALAELEKAYEELKSSQMKILQQEKMASIGQLAAGVAHEINNPMSFIASNLSTLEKYVKRLDEFIRTLFAAVESIPEPGVAESIAEKRSQLKVDHVLKDAKLLIQESLEGADRVKNIVQELKSFSRMDDEEYKIADINECLERAVTIVWNELKYKTTLKKEYGKLPRTKCYPRQINQVFVNLLINAADAIADKGVITLRTWHDGGFIWMQVTDTGSGIAPQNLSRIFEPFFTTKEASKGTGLGLSITYDIVQRHKGEITVQSEPGFGSTFTVKIPVVS